MMDEFEDRLDNKEKYPYDRPGTFSELLDLYDRENGTSYSDRVK